VKFVAAKRGVELRTHGDLWEFVTKLRTELKDPELSRLFLQLNYLHQDFYEGILPAEAVMDGAEAVKEFINELERLICVSQGDLVKSRLSLNFFMFPNRYNVLFSSCMLCWGDRI